eukprot:Skav204217  [mRNA]  locus=scaffold1606:201146:219491:- [translate_table: standard]
MSFAPSDPPAGKMSFAPSDPPAGKMSFSPNDAPGSRMSFSPNDPGKMSFGSANTGDSSAASGGKMSFTPNEPSASGKMSFSPSEPAGGKMSFSPNEAPGVGKMSFSPNEPSGASGIANAVLGSASHSVNSAIVLHILDSDLYDPLLYVILASVKQAKIFLAKSSPDTVKDFLHILSRESRQFHVHGPASALREYLLRVGLSCNAQGDLVVDNVIQLNLLTTPYETLKEFLVLEWQQHLLVLQCDRKWIGRFAPVDRDMTISLLRTFADGERLMLIREIAGGFQTKWQQSRWDPTETDECVFCGESDTRSRRLLSCPHFAAERASYAEILQDLEADFAFLCELPAPRVDPQAYFRRVLHYSMPSPVVTDAVVQAINHQFPDQAVVFYTDGSAFAPHMPLCRHASYSVVVDLAMSDAERIHHAEAFRSTAIMPPSLVKVAVARLPGRQVIHRAELQAAIWVFQHFARAIVVTDSSFVHGWVQRLKRGLLTPDLALHSDIDLLQQLQTVLLPTHDTRKVKAHQDLGTIDDSMSLYEALGNHCADVAAVTANRCLFPAIATQLEEAIRHMEETRQFFLQLFQYLVQLQTARTRAGDRETIHDQCVPAPQDILVQAKHWDPVTTGLCLLSCRSSG